MPKIGSCLKPFNVATMIAGAALWSVVSVTGARAVTVLGAGAGSCGEWTNDMQNFEFVAQSDEAWLAGYLSGYNYNSTDEVDIMKGLDAAARIQWISNYCVNHPLDLIFTAANELILELRQRRGLP
jgi:hypothetical protein